MRLSDILVLFASGLMFVRAMFLWKRGVQPKTMICEAILTALGMVSIATDRWSIGVALTVSAALLEGVMLSMLMRWKLSRPQDDS